MTSDPEVGGGLTRMVLGGRLRDARLHTGISRDDAAAAVGVPVSALSEIESGTRRVDGLQLRSFATLYRYPISYLLRPDVTDEDDIVIALWNAVATLPDDQRAHLLAFAEYLNERTAVRPRLRSRSRGR